MGYNEDMVPIHDADKAATLIQKIYRGYRVRHPFLPTAWRIQAAHFLSTYDFTKCPKALDGKTSVYLPVELPHLVIKLSGRASHPRLRNMLLARKICKLAFCNSLVIPKALSYYSQFLQNHLLIEERLPLNTDQSLQALIYFVEAPKLDRLVVEFAQFALGTALGDLVFHTFPHWGDCPIPRNDNFTLFYAADGQIKLGMVDLEKLGAQPDQGVILLELVYMFPLHAELIKQTALHFLPWSTIVALEPALAVAEKRGRKWVYFMGPGWMQYKRSKLFNFHLSEPAKMLTVQKLQVSPKEQQAFKYCIDLMSDFLAVQAKDMLPHVDDMWNERTYLVPLSTIEGYMAKILPFFFALQARHSVIPFILNGFVENGVIYSYRFVYDDDGWYCEITA